MLLIVGVGLAVNSIWSGTNVLGAQSDFSSPALLHATNIKRAQDHETPLTLNPQLTAAAQAKANDMTQRNYWSHQTPDGKTPWVFIAAAGYQYQAAAENLAYGFADGSDTVSAWMNSPEHRANILNASYQNVGFGVAESPDYQGKGPKTIVVAEYAQPAGAALTAASNTPSNTIQLAARPVSRIQVLTGGQAAWSALVVAALAGAALTLFVIRHGLYLKRLITEGEAFISNHPFLDIAIVFVFTTGFVLTRASGLIR